jgi:hypothetical protein
MNPVVLAAMAVVVLLLSAADAHAYLDAGTGSMLVQLLAGGVAGLLVLLRLYWRRLAVFLGFSAAEQGEERYSDAGDERR